jgi:sugar phosphate isomerase/epimerase
MSRIERLSFNQITADPWPLDEVIRSCSARGIPYIAVWRHKLDCGTAKAAAMIRDAGLHVSSLCRGGWFSAPSESDRRQRIDDNRVAIAQAAELGAPVLVMVAGPANGQTLDDARKTVVEGLLEILPDAENSGVVLGIESLHPMYAAERSVVVTLKQANDIVERLASPAAGLIVDAFHVWWDPEVLPQIERARGRIAGFHVSDWPVPLPGILMGRAMMGDGVIDLQRLRLAVEANGYSGPIEVEIFNDELWKMEPADLLRLLTTRFVERV